MTARSLEGVSVAVLRVETDSDAVADALRARGAMVEVVVVGHVVDRGDDEIHRAIGDLARFAWVAVTSAHAARRLAHLVDGWPRGTSVAAVGPATATAVRRAGLETGVVAPEGTAASLARVIDRGPVLFLAAARARPDLAAGLADRGIETTTVVAYDVVDRRLDAGDAARLASASSVVALSPRGVEALLELDAVARAAVLARPLVVIGPTTAARAAAAGIEVAAHAPGRDAPALVEAVTASLA